MQGWTCPNNANMPVGTVTALTDNRDGNVYAVAKLGMGWNSTSNTYVSSACWMIENLRLGNYKVDGISPTETFTTSNTNISSTPVITSLAKSDSEAWCTDNASAACLNQSKLNAKNTTNTVANMIDPNSNVYSYGNYYNWYSAKAGYGTLEGDTGAYSICPSNWKLPTGGFSSNANNSNFWQLGLWIMDGKSPSNDWYYPNTDEDKNASNLYASQAIRLYPNNYIYSSDGSSGRYWASTYNNSWSAFETALTTTFGQFGAGYLSKSSGLGIRCLAGS